MATFRGRNSPWLKRVLIPFWVVQIIFMLMLFCVSLVNATTMAGDGYEYGQSPNSGHVVWAFTLFGLGMLACIVINTAEIVYFALHKLHPRVYLNFQIIKALIWLILFIIYLVRLSHTTGKDDKNDHDYYWVADYYMTPNSYGRLRYHWSSFRRLFWGGDIAIIVLFLVFTTPMIYAIVVYRRNHRSNPSDRPFRGYGAFRRVWSRAGHAPPPAYEMTGRGESGMKNRPPIGGQVPVGEGGHV